MLDGLGTGETFFAVSLFNEAFTLAKVFLMERVSFFNMMLWWLWWLWGGRVVCAGCGGLLCAQTP